jgi:hypothetical protein
MASVMNIKESKEFCDDVFSQLEDVKKKVLALKMRSIGGTTISDIDGGKFARHLTELADMIDWKLQILSHSCSYNWKGSSNYEGDVSVNEMGRAPDSDSFSGGYVGG